MIKVFLSFDEGTLVNIVLTGICDFVHISPSGAPRGALRTGNILCQFRLMSFVKRGLQCVTCPANFPQDRNKMKVVCAICRRVENSCALPSIDNLWNLSELELKLQNKLFKQDSAMSTLSFHTDNLLH